ncbi:MAG: helix-turn-helix domain-containing protein [Planctomycetota bacterium]|nr:helix-turn-helix domain-containing protein [Planctomycetota bacterium]
MTETMTTDNEAERLSVDPAELLTAGDLAKRLRVSLRQVRKLYSEALVPAPVRLGRSVRWRGSEVGRWIEAGCPSRETWETTQNSQRGSDN